MSKVSPRLFWAGVKLKLLDPSRGLIKAIVAPAAARTGIAIPAALARNVAIKTQTRILFNLYFTFFSPYVPLFSSTTSVGISDEWEPLNFLECYSILLPHLLDSNKRSRRSLKSMQLNTTNLTETPQVTNQFTLRHRATLNIENPSPTKQTESFY